MKLYGFSPAFTGEVAEDLIQRNDENYPSFMFLKEHEESLEWIICGWATVIFTSSTEEALAYAAQLESMYGNPSGDFSS